MTTGVFQAMCAMTLELAMGYKVIEMAVREEWNPVSLKSNTLK